MSRKAGFWRNVGIIALAHVVACIALVRWSGASNKPERKEIVWLDVGTGGGDVAGPPAAAEAAAPLAAPDGSAEEDSVEENPGIPPAQSDLQLPTPISTPAATSPPRSKPSATPKSMPIPKASKSKVKKPVPKTTPEVTPKSKPKKVKSPATREERSKRSEELETRPTANPSQSSAPGGSGNPGGIGTGSLSGAAGAVSEANSYRKMLHDRFHSAWEQPTSIVAPGTKISALVKIRVEKDGRISDFTIVRASGNVVVDESVAEVAKRVKQVDPLPTAIARGREHFDVNINFEVNPE